MNGRGTKGIKEDVMKTTKYRPVGLATLLGGAIGWLVAWWITKRRKREGVER